MKDSQQKQSICGAIKILPKLDDILCLKINIWLSMPHIDQYENQVINKDCCLCGTNCGKDNIWCIASTKNIINKFKSKDTNILLASFLLSQLDWYYDDNDEEELNINAPSLFSPFMIVNSNSENCSFLTWNSKSVTNIDEWLDICLKILQNNNFICNGCLYKEKKAYVVNNNKLSTSHSSLSHRNIDCETAIYNAKKAILNNTLAIPSNINTDIYLNDYSQITKGYKQIPINNIKICDIECIDKEGLISIQFECFFDTTATFGTNTEGDDEWINVYATYDLSIDKLSRFLTICWSSDNDWKEFFYELSNTELLELENIVKNNPNIKQEIEQYVQPDNSVCHRCGCTTNSTIMSIFNKQMICDDCKKAEKEHPLYDIAINTERKSILAGDYNFIGIGYITQ